MWETNHVRLGAAEGFGASGTSTKGKANDNAAPKLTTPKGGRVWSLIVGSCAKSLMQGMGFVKKHALAI